MNDFNRRKVKYRLSESPTFDPDLSDEKRNQEWLLYEEQDGWFHTWTQNSEPDNKSRNILLVAYGIIEQTDGRLISIPFNWFRFIDNEKEMETSNNKEEKQ